MREWFDYFLMRWDRLEPEDTSLVFKSDWPTLAPISGDVQSFACLPLEENVGPVVDRA